MPEKLNKQSITTNLGYAVMPPSQTKHIYVWKFQSFDCWGRGLILDSQLKNNRRVGRKMAKSRESEVMGEKLGGGGESISTAAL